MPVRHCTADKNPPVPQVWYVVRLPVLLIDRDLPVKTDGTGLNYGSGVRAARNTSVLEITVQPRRTI